MIVSIDPGVHLAGIALWHNGVLGRAFMLKGGDALGMASELRRILIFQVETVVVEQPQVYVRRMKGDPNDLIHLAFVAGVLAAAVPPGRLVVYRPAEWKGQVPKGIMSERIKRALSMEERSVIELPKAKSLAHNVWDAIGIGLHYLGRDR